MIEEVFAPTYERMPAWAKTMYRNAEKNSALRKIPFLLSRDEFALFIAASDKVCAISGIAFNFEDTEKSNQRRPFYPSLDRINSDLPYQLNNVRLVCVAVNLAMNTWGEHIFRLIAKATTYNNFAIRNPFENCSVSGKLPGVVFKKSKKVGTQYSAIVNWPGVGRMIHGWYATPAEAFLRKCEVEEMRNAGIRLSKVGHVGVYSREQNRVLSRSRPQNEDAI